MCHVPLVIFANNLVRSPSRPNRAPHFSSPNYQKNSMIVLPMKNEDRDHEAMQDSSENSIVTKTSNDMTPLVEGFAPGRLDFICARGKRALGHSGNRRFRALVHSCLEQYSKTSSKLEKSLIVSRIINSVREASPEGGFFVKEKGGRWFEVGDHIAREKSAKGL
jgi:hypothetical protein